MRGIPWALLLSTSQLGFGEWAPVTVDQKAGEGRQVGIRVLPRPPACLAVGLLELGVPLWSQTSVR